MARAHPFRRWIPLLAAPVLLVAFTVTAQVAQPAVGLGTAGSFAVLGGSTVTNTGPSVIEGDLGVSPGSAVTGFPPGLVNGAVHAADAVGVQAKSNLTVAYDDAAGRTPPALLPGDLGGLFLTPGAYRRSSSLLLTGDVTSTHRATPTPSSSSRSGRRSPRRPAAAWSWPAAPRHATSSGGSGARRPWGPTPSSGGTSWR